MNATVQTITADRYELSPHLFSAGTRGSVGVSRMQFELSSDWDGLTTYVVFFPRRGSPVNVPYLGEPIDIPAEIMAYAGVASYVLSGVVFDAESGISQKMISLGGNLEVEFTRSTGSGNTRKVTPDTYDLFLDEAKEYMESVLRAAQNSGGNVSDEAIAEAVDRYFDENPIEVPVKTSDLQNDSGFITKAVSDLVNYYTKSQTYTQSEINAMVSAIPKFTISVVSALPTSGISNTTVYLLSGGVSGNLYTEYIYVNGVWEILGSQRVDLDGYVTDEMLTQALQDYVKNTEFAALAETVDVRMIPTYVLQEGETVDDAPEWADEIIDPHSEPESEPGGDVDLSEVNARLDKLSKAIADLTNQEDKVEYLVPSLTDSAYVSTSGTVLSNSEAYAYTEKIAVKKGQTVRAVVNNTANGGKDSYISFTAITAYVNGAAVSSLGVNGVGQSITEYVVPETVTEVIVSSKFFNTAYSNPRIEITTPKTYALVSLAQIRNDYTFSLPKKFYLRNGKTADIYLRNLTSPNYIVKIGNYTDSTTIRNTDERCSITANAAADKPIQYVVYDSHYNEIESGTMTLSIRGTIPASQKMLIIGDSFISMGEIESALRSLFTADGNTLTLIGTKGSGANLHEGYAGKKYTDFANGFSGSPFGESGFNFANYMSAKGYSGLNSVFIQLGTNDVSASNPNQDVSGVIDAMHTIINSIKSYDSNIKIYIGLMVMPNFDSEVFAETYNGIGWNWAMKQNMIRLNERIIAECESISNVKVVATNCVLDAAEDIRDNVHPTTEGFAKMATQLYYTMMS